MLRMSAEEVLNRRNRGQLVELRGHQRGQDTGRWPELVLLAFAVWSEAV